jgi:hypothetical protein
MKYTINTLADYQDAISHGLYLDFNQQEQAFDYCGPYVGLMVAMQGLRDAGAEFSHRVDRVMDTGDALKGMIDDVPRVYPKTGFSLHNVWGNV